MRKGNISKGEEKQVTRSIRKISETNAQTTYIVPNYTMFLGRIRLA